MCDKSREAGVQQVDFSKQALPSYSKYTGS